MLFFPLGDGIPTVFVAVAGRSNGLGPVMSGNTAYPVINCPPLTPDWGAQDVWSSLRMPSGKSRRKEMILALLNNDSVFPAKDVRQVQKHPCMHFRYWNRCQSICVVARSVQKWARILQHLKQDYKKAQFSSISLFSRVTKPASTFLFFLHLQVLAAPQSSPPRLLHSLRRRSSAWPITWCGANWGHPCSIPGCLSNWLTRSCRRAPSEVALVHLFWVCSASSLSPVHLCLPWKAMTNNVHHTWIIQCKKENY